MKSKKSGSQTVLWWVIWIVATLASFFVAAWIWTPIIARRFGSVLETRNAVIWVFAVFGTWMVILVPLIVVMYQKVDKAYEEARLRREKNEARFRSVFVERSKRLLPSNLSAKLKTLPRTLENGHLVHVRLKDGKRIPNVFIKNEEEVWGIYDFTEMPFEVSEILDIEPADQEKLPAFLTPSWLRLDGVNAPE
ncbi:MAG: hypothetical protein HYZ85_01180 [Candidatus Omnitrophica bacterium]|nr:hypothetical protein [Candidatus Omnitrophota bacterium]